MSKESFTVTEHQWGVIISAPIQISMLVTLFKFYRKHYGYNIIDGEIGKHFDGLCLTCENASKQWKKELGIKDER